MRADGLLNLLIMIQMNQGVSARTLADHFNVSLRTIYRAIGTLQRSGIEIVADRGRDGGFRVPTKSPSRVARFSPEEAQALPFINIMTAATALGLRSAAQAARAKTFAALPTAIQDYATRASERFHFDPVGWYERPAAPVLLRAVADATWMSQAIAIDYASWRERRVRVVEPLGIVCKGSSWYLVARRRQKISIYRIDSMHSIRVIPGRKVNRGNFNLERMWEAEVVRFEASLQREKARVRVGQNALSRITLLGADAAEAIRSAVVDAAGWRTAEIWIESVPHAAAQLIGFGADIEVVSPPQLRDELAARGAQMIAMYGARCR